jgi:hypothetical protein
MAAGRVDFLFQKHFMYVSQPAESQTHFPDDTSKYYQEKEFALAKKTF